MYFRVYRNVVGLLPLRKYVIELCDAETDEIIERNLAFKWFIGIKKRRMLKRAAFIWELNT